MTALCVENVAPRNWALRMLTVLNSIPKEKREKLQVCLVASKALITAQRIFLTAGAASTDRINTVKICKHVQHKIIKA